MIDASTRLFCVFGNPVGHSLSPVMHNAAFAHEGVNAAYLAFRIGDIRQGVEAVRALDIGGASITIPHKVAVMDSIDEVDPMAQAIGAVNTLVHKDGRIAGSNTDGLGAVRALSENTEIAGRRVALLGAGGAARAIGYAAMRAGGRVTVYNRTAATGESLAADLGASFEPMDALEKAEWDILVNTTPMGMHPHVDASPVPKQALDNRGVVMDIVYNPRKTRLLAEAGAAGCAVVEGLMMFVYQGALQFEAWTGRAAPVDVMKQAVIEALARRNG